MLGIQFCSPLGFYVSTASMDNDDDEQDGHTAQNSQTQCQQPTTKELRFIYDSKEAYEFFSHPPPPPTLYATPTDHEVSESGAMMKSKQR